MYELMVVITPGIFALGMLFGWWLRKGEIKVLRDAFENQHTVLRQSWETADNILKSSTEARERLLQALISMRREGFQVVDTTPNESWVLDDAHEAEVSEQRRNGGVSRAQRDELRGAVEEGIRGQPLRDQ